MATEAVLRLHECDGLLGRDVRLTRSARRCGSTKPGKYRAVADPGDREVDRADPSVPAAVAVAIAMGEATLRMALALCDPGELVHFGLHHLLGKEANALAHQVDLTVGAHPTQGLESRDLLSSGIVVLCVASVCYTNEARITRVAALLQGPGAAKPNAETRPPAVLDAEVCPYKE